MRKTRDNIRDWVIEERPKESYHPNARAHCCSERIEHVNGRVQPSCQSVIGGRGLLKPVYLGSKDGKNVRGRVASPELDHQGMREKVLLRLLFVHSQGSIEDGLEIGRKGSCERYLRHGSSREENWSGLRVILVLVLERVGNPNLLNWLAGNARTASA